MQLRKVCEGVRLGNGYLQTILQKLQCIFVRDLPVVWQVEEAADPSFLFGEFVHLGGLLEVDLVGSSVYDNLASFMTFPKFHHEFLVRAVGERDPLAAVSLKLPSLRINLWL